jgi:hypothetical protein
MSEPFVCPECTYPSRATHACDNPACFSNPTISESHKTAMRERAAKAVARRAEEAERVAFKRRLHASGFTSF